MSAMQETMLSARDDDRPAGEPWAAVKHAVSTMDLRNADGLRQLLLDPRA
jgi:hypothetical protein